MIYYPENTSKALTPFGITLKTMKTKIKHIDKCSRLFEVWISVDEVNQTLKDVYKEIKKNARIPGYRIGMAPQDLLERYHGSAAQEEAVKRLVPEGCKKALFQHDVRPINMPEVSDIKFDSDGVLFFTAKVEIRPEIKVKNYKGIKIKTKNINVSKEEVEQALKRLQEMNAEFVPVEDRKTVKKGDYTICDVEAFVDVRPISKKHENMWIMAEKDASLLGLGENLIGLDVGDIKEIKATLPENYPDKKFASKEAVFKIHMKEIKIKKLHNIDDEFAKDLGKENLKALEDEVEKQLLGKKQANEKIYMENQILDKLLNDYKFDIPPSMGKRQFEILKKQTEEELLSRGMHRDTVSEKIKELEPKLKNDAVNKVKIYFILEEISRTEKITIDNEDVDKRLKKIADFSNQSIETVNYYYEKNDLMGGLEEQLKEEKTLEWLLNAASVVEEK